MLKLSKPCLLRTENHIFHFVSHLLSNTDPFHRRAWQEWRRLTSCCSPTFGSHFHIYDLISIKDITVSTGWLWLVTRHLEALKQLCFDQGLWNLVHLWRVSAMVQTTQEFGHFGSKPPFCADYTHIRPYSSYLQTKIR